MAGLPHGIRRAFRLALGRPQIDEEVDAEVAFHLEMRTAELVARGLTPDAARHEAGRRFGDIERWSVAMGEVDRQRADRAQRAELLDALWRDLRYTARGLRRQPLFTAGVVLTLALGIGANATMFGIVDRLLLRPPPHVVAPEQIRRFYETSRDEGGLEQVSATFGYAAFTELRTTSRRFASLAVWSAGQSPMGRGTQAREIMVGNASASFFPTLGVRPQLGRFFAEEEDRPPAGIPVAVLGHELWQSEFGGDPGVLGRTLHIDGVDYEIVGVAPPGFAGVGLTRVDAWVPMSVFSNQAISQFVGDQSWAEVRGVGWLHIVGRLRPGVSDVEAEAELAVLYPRFLTSGPNARSAERIERERPRMVLGPIQAERGPDRSASAQVASWLLGVAAFVLVIACANVANLLLARAARRRREIAVRVALGVGRGRLVGQLLLESVLLAVLGGAAGLLLAQWGGGVVRTLLLPDVAWGDTLTDRRVLAFTMLAALATGMLAGLAPAVQATRPDLAGALKAGAREGGGRRSRTRSALLVLQAALSVVLLVGAGLFVRSLSNVTRVNLGLEPERLLVTSARLQAAGYSPTEVVAIHDRLLERVQGVPGVGSAAVTMMVPFSTIWTVDVRVPGRDSVPRLPGGDPLFNAVSPDYFRTIGTRVLQGRAFTDADRQGAERVVVVSRTTARTLWPDEPALGRCIRLAAADTAPCNTVVGVVEDVRWNTLVEEPRLQLYAPLAQQEAGYGFRSLLVRPAADPEQVAAAVQQALYELAPRLPFARVTPLMTNLDPQLRPWKLGAGMFTAFGILALVIAAVGLYSVLAYTVTQRAHELGVRVALGAGAGRVLRLVVGDGLRVTAVGVALGVVAALLLGDRVESLLYDVDARDPLVIGGVALVLLLVAAIASLLPALRAARVDPNVALRSD